MWNCIDFLDGWTLRACGWQARPSALCGGSLMAGWACDVCACLALRSVVDWVPCTQATHPLPVVAKHQLISTTFDCWHCIFFPLKASFYCLLRVKWCPFPKSSTFVYIDVTLFLWWRGRPQISALFFLLTAGISVDMNLSKTSREKNYVKWGFTKNSILLLVAVNNTP